MATVALSRPIPTHRSKSPTPPLAPTLGIDHINATTSFPIVIPITNKHIPVYPTGPVPVEKPHTPPSSPPSRKSGPLPDSLLYPADKYDSLTSNNLTIYKLEAAEIAEAISHLSRNPLPEATQVFPWLHGLHPCNYMQQAFFISRRRAHRRTPRCFRGITIVKAGGDLTCARLKGAIAPDEILVSGCPAEFIDIDPKEGFSVRNFQIQTAKVAMISDIIVYGEDMQSVRKLALDIASAQKTWRETHESQNHEVPHYNTFVCTSPFSKFESSHPEIVATDARGEMTGEVMDFFHTERLETCTMTKASEIAHNVWLGPTPDDYVVVEEKVFDVYIECNEPSRLNPQSLRALAKMAEEEAEEEGETEGEPQPIYLEFPSSGSIMPPSCSYAEADGIVESCKWIYHLANGLPASSPTTSEEDKTEDEDEEEELDLDGDKPMSPHSSMRKQQQQQEQKREKKQPQPRPRRILIHCTDGYTESSLLGLAYFIYSTGLPLHAAWVRLHTEKRRDFFAYPSDVALLSALAPRLLSQSPAALLQTRTRSRARARGDSQQTMTTTTKTPPPGNGGAGGEGEPAWLRAMDGSLPSRVTDYMYLGNLAHANNPALLRELGIAQVLSVGETMSWAPGEREAWGEDNVLCVEGVQDNGVDPLRGEFDRCLEFIKRGRRKGTATLVHCRVGVSRSATICIAEIMQRTGASYPRAYCYVRARRLNVIIQPHLHFSYELLKWEEELSQRRHRHRHGGSGGGGGGGRGQQAAMAAAPRCRELEWAEIAREIAAMNRPYSR